MRVLISGAVAVVLVVGLKVVSKVLALAATGDMLSGTPVIEKVLGVPSALFWRFAPNGLQEVFLTKPGMTTLLSLVDLAIDTIILAAIIYFVISLVSKSRKPNADT